VLEQFELRREAFPDVQLGLERRAEVRAGDVPRRTIPGQLGDPGSLEIARQVREDKIA
jgi:hypothetical protein